ncbi:MAG: hypothetical protein BWY71_02175 [Planctomycetes bacterium ADurb.Bin412]|nr:MAG: hypothetical protein BWY71_02175 [Planctomycetes bacterium ADurb.Bin412]
MGIIRLIGGSGAGIGILRGLAGRQRILLRLSGFGCRFPGIGLRIAGDGVIGGRRVVRIRMIFVAVFPLDRGDLALGGVDNHRLGHVIAQGRTARQPAGHQRQYQMRKQRNRCKIPSGKNCARDFCGMIFHVKPPCFFFVPPDYTARRFPVLNCTINFSRPVRTDPAPVLLAWSIRINCSNILPSCSIFNFFTCCINCS